MLETQRLMIRQGNEKDVEDIYLFRNTEFVLKYNCMEIADKASILKEISNEKLYDLALESIKYNNLKVMLTGGFFNLRIADYKLHSINNTLVLFEPMLVPKGLNYIANNLSK